MRVERLIVVVIWMSGCGRIWSIVIIGMIRMNASALFLLAVKGKTNLWFYNTYRFIAKLIGS
jgi:hypothetical protein